MALNTENIVEIIENALELSNGVLSIDSVAENIEQWDSLGHLSILVSLDKAYDGQVGKIKEMATAESVIEIVALLRENSLVAD